MKECFSEEGRFITYIFWLDYLSVGLGGCLSSYSPQILIVDFFLNCPYSPGHYSGSQFKAMNSAEKRRRIM